jgi:enamine deaminase RidA (YjgF/YER057c/UK114 family)
VGRTKKKPLETSGSDAPVRENGPRGGKYEPIIGYSRAVRVGDWVLVAGTTAADTSGKIIGAGDAYAQTVQALRTAEAALAQAGATMADVVRTRMFVTDISQWERYGLAHGEVFGAIRPAATMVEVTRLVDPAMLIEIELDAFSPRR